jgi:hypothetical protein
MRPPPCLTLPFPRHGSAAPSGVQEAIVAPLAKWPSRVIWVGFMEPVAVRLAQAILSVMGEWSKVCGIRFVYKPWPQAQVRITVAGSDWWSCVGTEALATPQNQPTMALGGCTLASLNPGGILHETGHVLGFEHEHQRADVVRRIVPARAYALFWSWYGWTKPDVDAYVLTALDPRTHWLSPFPDSNSIMAYELPAQIMSDAKAFGGTATGISAMDARWAKILYP